jgi:hypothetical protein
MERYVLRPFPDRLENRNMMSASRLPDFSVVVWIKKNEDFLALRSEALAAAGADPYESTEYQGMVDFHWSMNNIGDARKLADALKIVSQRPRWFS